MIVEVTGSPVVSSHSSTLSLPGLQVRLSAKPSSEKRGGGVLAITCLHLVLRNPTSENKPLTGLGTELKKPEVFGLDGGAFLGWLRRAQKDKIHVDVFSPAPPPSPRSVYEDLVAKGVIVPAQEVPPPTVPMDYSWARVGAVCVPECGQGRSGG